MAWRSDEEPNAWRAMTVRNIERSIAMHGIQLLNMRGEDGWTDLHRAAWCCPNPDVITYMISQGWNRNARTTENNTPLHYAARYNTEPQVVVVLASINANGVVRNADARLSNTDEETPYNCAQQNENLAGTDILIALRTACRM